MPSASNPAPSRTSITVGTPAGGDDNRITTSRYNPATFLFINLYEQFSKLANFYFLTIAVLMFIPGLSPLEPWSSLFPLLFVLALSALREAYEDYRRHLSDRQMNSQAATLYSAAHKDFVATTWQALRVGDVIRVRDGEVLPADIVVLTTEHEAGVCFIETANLDGESTLKVRQPLPVTVGASLLDLCSGAKIESEPPSLYLYDYSACYSDSNGGDRFPVSIQQLLLRGSTLRNSGSVVGVCVFVGHSTKLMLNSTRSRTKSAIVDRSLNRVLWSIFFVLIALCVMCALLWDQWLGDNQSKAWYLRYDLDKPDDSMLAIITFLILYNNLIPISLYVTIELVKVAQAWFLEQDLTMYDAEIDRPALARTSNLSDELGQVQWVFSDKTGTLTRNEMVFHQASIAGKLYETLNDIKTDFVAGADPRVDLFVRILYLCHSCQIQLDAEPFQTAQSTSPDEEALYLAAAKLGCVAKSQSMNHIDATEPQRPSEVLHWEILQMIDFTADRKRMSVLVRSPLDGQVLVLVKGADSTVIPRLAGGQDASIAAACDHIEAFAKQGLRTLAMAYRTLDDNEYASWAARWKDASLALDNRQALLDELADEVETDLTLVGASGVEDKLQEGVPETIAQLRKAGLAIWVLTGDKQETAINIGMSCNLLTRDDRLVIVNVRNAMDARREVEEACEAYDPGAGEMSLCVDGESLVFLLAEDGVDSFLQLARLCKTVICCRVSPLQKAAVVTLIKSGLHVTTLAIGDGANDVAMIKAADLGIGIMGKEGRQAVLVSDYAIGQFRFLQPLLLHHGHYSYIRIRQLAIYSFYKNFCFVLTSFWYSFYTGFSGQTLHDDTHISLYNALFTFVPTFALALFDVTVPKAAMLEYPQLYSDVRKSRRLDNTTFWLYLGRAIVHSLIIFAVATAALSLPATGLPEGYSDTGGMWSLGTAVYTGVLFVVNGQLLMMTHSHTIVDLGIIIVSLLAWFVFLLVFHSLPNTSTSAQVFGVIFVLARVPAYWFALALTIAWCLGPDALEAVARRNWWPENWVIVQEEIQAREKGKKVAPLGVSRTSE